MIAEGLRVLLFGMAGIFAVMGIIIATIYLLKHMDKGTHKGDPSL